MSASEAPRLFLEPVAGFWVNNISPFAIRFPEGWPVDGIRWYGLAYVAGFLAAAWLLRSYRKAGRITLDADACSMLLTAVIIGTVVGGRLGYVLGYMLPRDPGILFKDPLVIFKVTDGGMASHGGMIGIALATWWFARKVKQPFARIADIVVTLGPAGVVFGRLANFVNGELWGRETEVPWAVVFRYPDARLPGGAALWLAPRHPSQLYAMVLEGVILLAWTQWRFRRKTPLPVGQLTGEFMLGYALVRIVGELWREPDVGVSLVLGLSRGQFYSVFLGLAGILCIVLARRRAGPVAG